MRSTLLVLILALIPIQAHAFFFETVYATDTPATTQDPSGLSGRAARKYREQLQKQYEAEAAASSESITKEDPITPEVPVKHYYDQEEEDTSLSSESSESSTSSTEVSSQSSYVPVATSPKEQEELDRLTLEQLEEYANEASANIEEQMQKLEEGFTITSTSTLGSPLTSSQRDAVLRRNVRTVDQLKLFARALAESDDNVRQITVDEHGVTMSLRREAKLFGFIRLPYIEKTTVSDDGVNVSTSWWSMFARTSTDTFVELLEDGLSGLNVAGDSLQGLLQSQQQIMQMMSDVAKG